MSKRAAPFRDMYLRSARGSSRPAPHNLLLAVSHLDPQCDLHELLQLHHQLRQAATIIACLGHIIVKALQYRIQGCKVLLSLRQTLNVI